MFQLLLFAISIAIYVFDMDVAVHLSLHSLRFSFIRSQWIGERFEFTVFSLLLFLQFIQYMVSESE